MRFGCSHAVLALTMVVLLAAVQAAPTLPETSSGNALAPAFAQPLPRPDGGATREASLALVPQAVLEWPASAEYGGPPDIESEAELRALGPFVAPILYGGLGNVLFQLAALLAHSQDTKLPLVIG